jgi:hypothetical protein
LPVSRPAHPRQSVPPPINGSEHHRQPRMADLYTGAIQRRVTIIPGSATGHSASRSTVAPGTALSLDLPSPGLPADHATCGTPPCPGG